MCVWVVANPNCPEPPLVAILLFLYSPADELVYGRIVAEPPNNSLSRAAKLIYEVTTEVEQAPG